MTAPARPPEATACPTARAPIVKVQHPAAKQSGSLDSPQVGLQNDLVSLWAAGGNAENGHLGVQCPVIIVTASSVPVRESVRRQAYTRTTGSVWGCAMTARSKKIYLISNGDFRDSACEVCWPEQEQVLKAVAGAFSQLGHKTVILPGYDA